MRLNEKLHMVVPLYSQDGDVETIYAYVHSAPISREVFEAHFMLISKTFAAIYGEGLGEIVGPRVAKLIMMEVAKRTRDMEGATALINEIRRLTNVVTRGPGGWVTIPFQDAVDRGDLDADDLAEVENAICFFTVVSATHKKQILQAMLPGAVALWGGQTSSSDCTGFVASLRTSTATGNTGASQTPGSLVPY